MRVVLALLLIGSNLLAADFSRATVKVFSRSHEGIKEFRGSGVAFSLNGGCFVVTSDHVMLHEESSAYEHRVEGSNVSGKAHLLVADWGNGLGLFRLETSKCSGLNLEDLAPASLKVGDQALVFGYPYDSGQIFSSDQGHVSKLMSPQTLFADLPYLTELEKSHGEFGMSGGSVTTKLGEFVGILSHQKISDPGSLESTLLVIPAEVVHDWIQIFFTKPIEGDPAKYPLIWIQTPELQMEGITDVISSSLQFSVGSFLSGDPSHIEICALAITKRATSKGFPDAYFDRAEKYLQAHLSDVACIYFLGFRQKKLLGNPLPREAAWTLPQFFKTWKTPDAEPMIAIGVPGYYDLVKNTYDLHDELFQGYQNMGCDRSSNRLCEIMVEILGRTLNEESPRPPKYPPYLKPSDLEIILDKSGKFADAWHALPDYVASGLERSLSHLKASLEAITF